MYPTQPLLLVAFAVAFHSFTTTLALSSFPDDPQITPAPTLTTTPALQPRDTVAGAPGTPILSTLHYAFTDLPYQVYPFPVLRGPQFGFNQCNATTLGDGSDCQTLVFNGPDDFCLWGSPDANGTIADVEAKVVAYCTQPTHGTRLIPPGAITGLQWMKTSAYIQVTGFIKNSALSLSTIDEGGELDPHGADLQGNPLGGVVFSSGTADSDGNTLTQVFNWNSFVGGDQFCFKACYNSVTSPDYCENRYDLVGCAYNMPSAARDGEFTSCEGEVQDVVGVYTTGGHTTTWSMPDPLNTPPPYLPRIPASSNCHTFLSPELFPATSTIFVTGPVIHTTTTPTRESGRGSASGTMTTPLGTSALTSSSTAILNGVIGNMPPTGSGTSALSSAATPGGVIGDAVPTGVSDSNATTSDVVGSRVPMTLLVLTVVVGVMMF